MTATELRLYKREWMRRKRRRGTVATVTILGVRVFWCWTELPRKAKKGAR